MLIGISGKIGTGKSTLGKYIADALDAKLVSFGDLLKQEVAEKFNFDLGFCYSQAGKDVTILHPDLPNGMMTVRQILQWWGSDVRRKQAPNYWSELMRLKLNKIECDVVIDDVRFPDEAELVRRRGYLVRIEPYEGWKPGEYADHWSETALDDWDCKKYDLVCSPEYGQLKSMARTIVNLASIEAV